MTADSVTEEEVSLHLNPVRSEDAGQYSCAVDGLKTLGSPVETLMVRGQQPSVMTSALGITVVLVLALILSLVGFILCRRNTSKLTADDGQGDSVYVNNPSRARACTTDQTVDTTDNEEEDCLYENFSSLVMTPSEKDQPGKK
ncbi:hypothetical protein DPEC_G00171000 [Dallia pectoralis]|uniref:Uncharacterized protein n=1 Tax=Dallia pectoralis TaxID=75939 RepID=A0ACC2GDR4_DALPE|nr:hypothetical protein DPEC_G00171000 [Dallia pectoralis]